MSKDFNIYKWRREYLAESMLKEEQDDAFAKGWMEKITPETGELETGKSKDGETDKTKKKEKYTHIINNAPIKQYERIENVVDKAGLKIVRAEDLPVDGRMKLYLIKK